MRGSHARRPLVAGAVALALCGAVLFSLAHTDGVGAQVPTTLPTSAPTTEPPSPTTAPPTTSRPTTTQRAPVGTTNPPAPEEPEEEEPGQSPGSPTSGRPGAPPPGDGEVPAPDINTPDAVQLGNEEDPLVTSSASGRLPAIFPWLSLIGMFVFAALVGLQWALTNPARRGSRTL